MCKRTALQGLNTHRHERESKQIGEQDADQEGKTCQRLIYSHRLLFLCLMQLRHLKYISVVILLWTVYQREHGNKITVQQMIPSGETRNMRAVWLISTLNSMCYSLTDVHIWCDQWPDLIYCVSLITHCSIRNVIYQCLVLLVWKWRK